MNNPDRFLNFFEWLMRWEGESYENDPDDAGGETKFGIDKRSHPGEDIRNLTRERAKAIYRSEYWDAVKAEELPHGVGEIVADIAVNNGISRASRWLQQLVGASVDGRIGPRTVNAAQLASKPALIEALLDRRDEFYHSIARGRQAKFLRGWLNRNRDLRRYVNA